MFRSTSTAFTGVRRAFRVSTATRRFFSNNVSPTRRAIRPSAFIWTSGALVAAFAAYQTTPVLLDAEVKTFPTLIGSDDVVVDEDSGIAFPQVLKVESKSPLPPFELVGVGVRTVSFLGIKVYSVGFYADLANPKLKIPLDATPEEKIDHIIRTSACLIRIVPTRSTGYTHLRDGFVRAIQARLAAAKAAGEVSPAEEAAAQSPIRQLKTLFPNTPLTKGTPLDIILTEPEPMSTKRALIFRDLGVVYDDWVTREFVLAYFEGKEISPPLKRKVFAALEHFSR